MISKGEIAKIKESQLFSRRLPNAPTKPTQTHNLLEGKMRVKLRCYKNLYRHVSTCDTLASALKTRVLVVVCPTVYLYDILNLMICTVCRVF